MKKNFLMLIVVIGFTVNLMAQKVVTGTVTDETQKPLSGVTVQVKGTTVGTFTDTDGKFTLSMPADARILSFSFVGMNPVEVDITDRTTVNISMSVAVGVLEEVVVVGYGTQRRGSITGSISSVRSDDIQELPVNDAGSALQGRATGIVALSAGNRPGQGVTIRIRGRRSLTATNDPLYVVDGIPYEGNIADINPRDIKSMEILKDASVTAIYGSRGANGVILVTTNRGGNFPTTVSYSGQYGITSVLALPDMMNGEEYYRMKVVAQRPITAEEEAAHNQGVSTDWLSLVLDNGYQQNHQLSIRGGEAKTGFALSANYFNEQEVIKTQDFTRY